MHIIDSYYEEFRHYITIAREAKRKNRASRTNLIAAASAFCFLANDLFALLSSPRPTDIYVTWRDSISPEIHATFDFITSFVSPNAFRISYYLDHSKVPKGKFIRCESIFFLSATLSFLTKFRFLPSLTLPWINIIIRFLKPGKIYISDGYTSKLAWHFACIHHKVQAFEVQHAHFDRTHRGFQLLAQLYSMYHEKPSIILYDQAYTEEALALGFTPFVVPECDCLANTSRSSGIGLLQPDSRTDAILIIGQPSYSSKLLRYARDNFCSLNVSYRPHPLEDISVVLSISRYYLGRELSIDSSGDYQSYRLILSHSSTLGHKLQNAGFNVCWISGS